MKKKRECLVRGNNVYLYGKLAKQVEIAIELSGLTPKQWLNRAMRQYFKSLKVKAN